MPTKRKSAATKARNKKAYNKKAANKQLKSVPKIAISDIGIEIAPVNHLYSSMVQGSHECLSPPLSCENTVLVNEATHSKDNYATGFMSEGQSEDMLMNLDEIPQMYPIAYRMADTDQSDRKLFGEAAGRQCMPSAYIAIATHITGEKTEVWSGSTIKMIISQGSMMYRECKPQAYDYCNVEDLPKCFTLNTSIIEQVELSDRAGVIESQDQNSEMKVTNVYQNLQYIFGSPVDSGALLTMSGYTVALLKERANYWIFDSHKRNTQGRPDGKNGHAGIFKYASLLGVANYIVDMASKLSNSLVTQYELIKVHFIQRSAIQYVHTQSIDNIQILEDGSSNNVEVQGSYECLYPPLSCENMVLVNIPY